MKSTLIFILILAMLLSGGSVLAETTDSEIYQALMESEYTILDDAWEKVGQMETDDPEILELQKTLSDLRLCDGRYVQLPDEDGTGKIYSADIVFYLKKGTPYCKIDYTNYGGTISDGAVEKADAGEYLFVSHPDGVFFSNKTVFTLEFAPERLHLQWAEGTCEYTLVRGTDEQLAAANYEPPFTETDTYAKLLESFDKAFGSMGYSSRYAEDSKTLTVYLQCGMGYRDTLVNHAASVREKWQGILNSLLSFSEKVDSALNLATRDGLTDFTQSEFTIIFVEQLKFDDIYSEDDYLAIITDGAIKYNLVEETLKSNSVSSGNSSSKSATIGERNALKQAKLYLDVMPFSYTGLIEQLEYEGYSYSEAKYGADNCGADWYRQAVKSAENYLEIMPFSRSGLIDQLEYDGYTYDQAVYGAERNGY